LSAEFFGLQYGAMGYFFHIFLFEFTSTRCSALNSGLQTQINPGGHIRNFFSASIVRVRYYDKPEDQPRLVLEIIVVVLWFYYVYSEGSQVVAAHRHAALHSTTCKLRTTNHTRLTCHQERLCISVLEERLERCGHPTNRAAAHMHCNVD
jgi:hypothetical protein